MKEDTKERRIIMKSNRARIGVGKGFGASVALK